MADLFIRDLSHSITARYFSSNPSDSGSLRTPCPPASKPAGRRGITPAFGYSAPHPSAGGTLTLLIHALPSAHYDPVRILIRVHVHRSAVAFMNRPGLPVRARMRLPRFRAKNFSTCARPQTARGSPMQAIRHGTMLPSLQRNEIGTSELDPFRSSILGPWSPL